LADDHEISRHMELDNPVLKRRLQRLAGGFKAVAGNQAWLEGAPLAEAARQTT
jgi:hypothetical protein